MPIRSWPRSKVWDSRGQAVVEVAFVLPIVVVLVLTLLVGGILMITNYGVTVAAREGARAYSLGDTARGAEGRMRDVLRGFGLDPGRAQVQAYSCYGGQYTCARVQYRAATIVPAFVFGGTGRFITLESTAAFRKEGP